MKKIFYAKIEMEVPKVHKGFPIRPDNEICENLSRVIKGGLAGEVDSDKLKVKVSTQPITLVSIISPSKN